MAIIIDVVDGVNDFKTMDPVGASLWHPTKNGSIKPNEIYYKTIKKYWFFMIYKDQNGKSFEFEWKESLCNIYKSKIKCPYLSPSNNYIYTGFNDLYSKEKELIDNEWDWDKNEIDPTKIRRNSDYMANWKCDCGHEYKQRVKTRVNNKFCPICSKQLRTSFPEQAIYFYIKQVYPKAINSYRPDFLKLKEIDIYIPEINLGIEYDGFASHFNKIDNDLLKNKLCKENGIKLIRIREMELPKINDGTEIILCRNDYKSLEGVIKNILSRNKCFINIDINIKKDFYEIKKKCEANILKESLKTRYPEITSEWDYEKNNNINPEYIQPNSNYKYWWKCKKGHSWEASPNKRVSSKRGCPYCSNQKVMIGENDLATTRPDLLLLWDYKKNKEIKPTEVTRAGKKEIFWKCPECDSEWKESLNHVDRRKYLCKYCKKIIKKELKNE